MKKLKHKTQYAKISKKYLDRWQNILDKCYLWGNKEAMRKKPKEYNSYEDELNRNILCEPNIAYNVSLVHPVYGLIQSIKEGISFSSFEKLLKKIPYSINEWSKFLHISDRTMQRYKKGNKAFEPIHAERIMKISLLYDYGAQVFGDAEDFHAWMETTNIAMGGIKPKDLLDTYFGIEAVKDELGRIEYGVLA